jgi:hypothetical protein
LAAGELHFYGKNGAMRWIYISPHLDDAALSAGGLIHEQTQAGLPVEIWTLMSGFPLVDEVSPLAQVMLVGGGSHPNAPRRGRGGWFRFGDEICPL